MTSTCCLCGDEGQFYLCIGMLSGPIARFDLHLCHRHADILVGFQIGHPFLRLDENATLIDFRQDADLMFGEPCYNCNQDACAIVHWKPLGGQTAVPGMYVCQQHFDFLAIKRGELRVKQGLDHIRKKFLALQQNPFSPKNHLEEIWGIFWDYENVPLRKIDGPLFLEGLRSFIQQHSIAFARVYCHLRAISSAHQHEIESSFGFTVKVIASDAPNATDTSLIQSCLDILKKKPEITHILLITGDIDYTILTNSILQHGKSVVLIGHKENYNLKLVREVHELLSVSFVTSFPSNWWTCEPLAELNSISRLADPSNTACIEELLEHLDIKKPYQTATALTGLGQLINETFPNQNRKSTLSHIQDKVLRFQREVERVRKKELIERVNCVLRKINCI